MIYVPDFFKNLLARQTLTFWRRASQSTGWNFLTFFLKISLIKEVSLFDRRRKPACALFWPNRSYCALWARGARRLAMSTLLKHRNQQETNNEKESFDNTTGTHKLKPTTPLALATAFSQFTFRSIFPRILTGSLIKQSEKFGDKQIVFVVIEGFFSFCHYRIRDAHIYGSAHPFSPELKSSKIKLKINWSVKTPLDSLSMGVALFGLWAPDNDEWHEYIFHDNSYLVFHQSEKTPTRMYWNLELIK